MPKDKTASHARVLAAVQPLIGRLGEWMDARKRHKYALVAQNADSGALFG